jgi:thioredoxin reductase (NADPH)
VRTNETATRKEEIIEVQGCFIYIGQVPANEAFKNVLDFDNDGYIIVNAHNETKINGIYAAGDIIKKDTYQN